MQKFGEHCQSGTFLSALKCLKPRLAMYSLLEIESLDID